MVEVWDKVIKDLRLNKSSEQAVQNWIKGVSIINSSWELAEDLKQSGYRLAICSNNGYSVEEVFKRKKLFHFEEYIESWKEGLRKPEKGIYRIVETRLGYSGDKIFFIDDKQTNLDTAREFGWQTFLFSLGEDMGNTSCDQLRKILLSTN